MSEPPSGTGSGTQQERAARARALRERIKLGASGKSEPSSPREATDEKAREKFAQAREEREGKEP